MNESKEKGNPRMQRKCKQNDGDFNLTVGDLRRKMERRDRKTMWDDSERERTTKFLDLAKDREIYEFSTTENSSRVLINTTEIIGFSINVRLKRSDFPEFSDEEYNEFRRIKYPMKSVEYLFSRKNKRVIGSAHREDRGETRMLGFDVTDDWIDKSFSGNRSDDTPVRLRVAYDEFVKTITMTNPPPKMKRE